MTTLGPGKRIGIWFQGCSIRCPGCISADTWAFGRGQTTVRNLLEAINPWLPLADGFTISGGEPFDQPLALLELLRSLRQHSSQDVLVYSGHPIETIEKVVQTADGLIDVLISDPFLHTAPQSLALRGSDNQRLQFLTPLGTSRFASYVQGARDNASALDVMFDEEGQVWLAGIPQRNDMRRLRELLQAQGHSILMTDSIRNNRE